MTGRTRARRLNPNWYFLLPEVAAPVGGGLIKLGQASTWAAVSVGLAPYVLLAALYAVFVIGYAPAVICSLYFADNKHEAAEQLITTSASVIVALLTLTPPGDKSSMQRPGRSSTQIPAQGA
jgi:hypothetical protein